MKESPEEVAVTPANRYDYDVRQLAAGDAVEVFIEANRRWEPGVFAISTAGMAFVEIRGRVQFRFEQALLMGLRRITDAASDERWTSNGDRMRRGRAHP